jgi:hypothetical protein
MREILEYAIQKLENAYLKLKEGVLLAKDDLNKDSVHLINYLIL